jgi:phenylacetate-CoA ligase
MIHLRGINLYPAALEAIVRRFPEVVEYRVTVDRAKPAVRIEVEPAATDGTLAERVGRAIRDELFVRTEVAEVAPGTLPRFELKAKRIINHRDTENTEEGRKP